ncbi:MAG: hypothetical protein ABR575_00560 [Actinomycetota bacterium]
MMTALIGASVLLIVGSAVALAFGWGTADQTLIWTSIGASLGAGLLLGFAWFRTRRGEAQPSFAPAAAAWSPSGLGGAGATGEAASERTGEEDVLLATMQPTGPDATARDDTATGDAADDAAPATEAPAPAAAKKTPARPRAKAKPKPKPKAKPAPADAAARAAAEVRTTLGLTQGRGSTAAEGSATAPTKTTAGKTPAPRKSTAGKTPAPTKTPAGKTPAPSTTTAASTEIVAVPDRGKFHRAGCRFASAQGAVPMTKATARRRGYAPCGVCKP